MDWSFDVVVCDVSGHGISSALVANRIYSETMSQIERGADLGSMLRHLNHFAVQNLASSSFYFTLAAVRFHQSRGCSQFAGAGHPPAIVIRRGQMTILSESPMLILMARYGNSTPLCRTQLVKRDSPCLRSWHES
jgi:sigma-B regulation protein RsbU (phosphoserine phosphatase)